MRGKGKPFKKGHSVKSPGRPVYPDEVKAIRKLNGAKLAEHMDRYIHMPVPELEALIHDRKLPAFEIMIIRALIYAIKKNDKNSRDFIIERLCGKVPDKVSLDANISSHKSIIDEITSDE